MNNMNNMKINPNNLHSYNNNINYRFFMDNEDDYKNLKITVII